MSSAGVDTDAAVLDRDKKDLVKPGLADIKSINSKLDEIAASGWLDAEGNMHVKPEAFTEYKGLLDKAEQTYGIIRALERKGELDAWLDAPAGAPAALQPGQAMIS